MLPQLPCRWAHCLAEATVICSTEFASSFSLYGLWVFQLSRFFSRYRLPRCVLFACILTLAEWNAQHFNVVIHFPLKFVLSEFVHFFTEILHLKFIIKASNSLLRSTKIERDKLPPLQIALLFVLFAGASIYHTSFEARYFYILLMNVLFLCVALTWEIT